MFRFIRPRKPLVSMSRLPLRIEAQHQRGDLTNFQVVGVKKARAGIKTIIGSMFAVYIGTTIYSTVVLDPLARAAGETLKDLPEDELEDDPGPIFIPFPGTTKQGPLIPYRGSDPEWQEFVKISKDKALVKKVREDLAGFVVNVAAKHPMLAARCGTDMKLRRFWLDVDFPPAPPPVFTRKGLEIGNGSSIFEVTTRTVDSSIVFRIRQALWPSAVTKSFWSFTKVMIADEMRRVAEKLGLRTGAPAMSLDQLIAHQQQLMKGGQAASSPTKAITPTQASNAPPGPKEMIDPSAKEPAMTGKESDAEKLEAALNRVNARTMAIYAHFFRPIMAFKAKLAQTWRPVINHNPRGSILVSGLVELDTAKATLVFDVRAAWDPKTKEYDARSMVVQLRRMQLKKQAPVKKIGP